MFYLVSYHILYFLLIDDMSLLLVVSAVEVSIVTDSMLEV